MDRLESILFLTLCAGIPVAMFVLGAWQVVQFVRRRGSWNREVEGGGWQSLGEEAGWERLEGTRLAGGRVKLDSVVAKGDAMVASHVVRRHRNSRTRRSLLIVRRRAPGPTGVIQRRGDEGIEKMVIGIADAMGVAPEERPGWEWALLSADGDWFRDDQSEALRGLLRDGEHLHLSPGYVVLSAPHAQLSALLTDGRVERLALL